MNKFLYINDRSARTFVVNGTGPTLPLFQTLVEGYIDIVTANDEAKEMLFPSLPAGHSVDVVVNDEGLYTTHEDGSPFDLNLWGLALTGQKLVGPIVLAIGTPDGEMIGFTDEMLVYITDLLMVDDNGGNGWEAEGLATHFATVATV